MIAWRISARTNAVAGPGWSPDDIDVPVSRGEGLESIVLRHEWDAKISSRRIEEAVCSVARKGARRDLSGPSGRDRGKRSGHRAAILHDLGDPMTQWPVKFDPAIAKQHADLPPRDRTHEKMLGITDCCRCRRGDAGRPGEPPDEHMRIEQQVQRTPRSASQASPVEKYASSSSATSLTLP